MTSISMQTNLLDGMALNAQAKQTLAACQKLHPENTITLSNLIFILRDGTIYERDGALDLSRYLMRLAPIDSCPQTIAKFVAKFSAYTLRHYFADVAYEKATHQKVYDHVVHILNLSREGALAEAGNLIVEHNLTAATKDVVLRYILSILAQASLPNTAFYEAVFTACRMGVLDSLPKDPQAFFHPEANYHALADLMADAQHATES